MITAVTTCMGRLDHLETTLPLMLNEFDRVIVVDWSCPQNSGEWARDEGADVVFHPGEEYFNASRARNLGARQCQTRKVCFLDADTMVFPGIVEEIERKMSLQTMLISPLAQDGFDVPNLCGFLAVDVGQFWGVKGYNESLEGYGMEDFWLRAQLVCERGLKAERVSPHLLGGIRHPMALRQKHFREPIEVSAKRTYGMLMQYLSEFGIVDWETDPKTAGIAYRHRP